MNTLDGLLDELADRIAARVAEKLRGATGAGVIDQSTSPMGRRRHIAAVRSRMARGEAGAGVAGRRYLLTPKALEEELSRAAGRTGQDRPKVSTVREELERELRMIRRPDK